MTTFKESQDSEPLELHLYLQYSENKEFRFDSQAGEMDHFYGLSCLLQVECRT